MALVCSGQMAKAAPIPECNEDAMVTPCILAAKDAGTAMTDMLFNNAKGFAAVSTKAKIGFMVEELRVTLVSEKENPRGSGKPRYESEMKYELLLRDCRGTDACNGSSIWTVTEDSSGDGYGSDSTFTDTLVAGEALPVNQ